ncbi:MAG TPA: hybrid sensor histidine kinase/response regulator, partial [Hyphomonadaceae bacterium]|nr:hybrid sensor histidine kinase/response regulator [Hyphomonadaceae bacterium]
TPMNGILGVSGALNRTDLTTEQSEMVELIQQSTQMLERQLSDVLDVSKVEAGKLELIRNPTNLASCVTELCDFHRHTARERGLDLNLNFDVSAHGYFLADEVRIRQVLNNLITNAIKFTSEGSVTIDVSGGEYLDVTRQVVSFKVTDTGVGMNAESLAQIFEPYAQPTKNVAEPNRGTGLGLTISKSLVELMKGEI